MLCLLKFNMYVVLFICVCYEIEHMALKQKSLDFFFRKKSENSVEDDVKFVLNNMIKKVVASENPQNNLNMQASNCYLSVKSLMPDLTSPPGFRIF